MEKPKRAPLVLPRRKEKYEVAYHYTGIDGFFGITESNAFWLTNAYYLNDKNETKWPIQSTRPTNCI
jgi:hypothetical protein